MEQERMQELGSRNREVEDAGPLGGMAVYTSVPFLLPEGPFS